MIRNIMKRQVFLSSSCVLEWFFCFVFEKAASSLPMELVMLFIDIGTRSN